MAARALALLCLIGALAGLRLHRPADTLVVTFLVDVSDSVGAGGRAVATDWLRRALAAMPDDDRAGIVHFGAGPMVERLPSSSRELGELAGQPPAGRTDIGAAIRLGLALQPPNARRRLVILSDSRDTEGGLAAGLRAAATGETPVGVVTIAGLGGDGVAVRHVQTPSEVRLGDRFTVEVQMTSTVATPTTLRLYADNRLPVEQAVTLTAGDNRLTLAVIAAKPGFQALRAEIEPALDTLTANNSLAAYTTVRGPARSLLIEGEPGEGEPLAAALSAAGLLPTRLAPTAARRDLAGLAAYDAVVLVDVPADALNAVLPTLQGYVRDLGRGPLVIGGEDSYGLGGYAGSPIEAVLPVSLETRSNQSRPQVALGLTIDTSGSMGRCHAAPGATGPSRIERGAAKIDMAKEAALQSIRLLAPSDEIGIVAFDSQARWVSPGGVPSTSRAAWSIAWAASTPKAAPTSMPGCTRRSSRCSAARRASATSCSSPTAGAAPATSKR